ncbi:MAG: TetR/AcrR family transcriptional regulator, partial [Proteobacteria bacterium]|nr:TetR/AcrR family transcriptional regulator [Pseudomonadota bacterium]
MKKQARAARQSTLRQPTQSRSRESTEALLEIGRRLIEQHGIDNCSMNEVAAAAGSSVGSLYFRFGNKERFVGEVMRRLVDATHENALLFLGALETTATSPSDVIEATTRWFAAEFSKNQGLLRAQMRRALDDPREWQPFQKLGREVIEGGIRILERLPQLRHDNGWQRRVRIAMQMVIGTLN